MTLEMCQLKYSFTIQITSEKYFLSFPNLGKQKNIYKTQKGGCGKMSNEPLLYLKQRDAFSEFNFNQSPKIEKYIIEKLLSKKKQFLIP